MIATKPYLIVVPVGNPVEKFIKQSNYPIKIEDHWRWIKNDLNYEILAVQYGDFVPEKGSYDILEKIKGQKWEIIKQLDNRFDLTDWEYVGFYDDDLIADYNTINNSFEYARENNLKAFQLSLAHGSESQYPCTQWLPNAEISTTNFIEIMCPVFNRINLAKVLDLIGEYPLKHAWGLDYVFSEYLQVDLNVLHQYRLFHPSRPDTGSSYNKDEAMKEMNDFLYDIYPSIMKKLGRDVTIDYSKFQSKTLKVTLTDWDEI